MNTHITPSQRLERAHVSLLRDKEYMWLVGIIPMGRNEVVDDPQITARTDGLNTEYGKQFIGRSGTTWQPVDWKTWPKYDVSASRPLRLRV
jgi:hypothetical protein